MINGLFVSFQNLINFKNNETFNDNIEKLIRESWLYTKYSKYESSLQRLHKALELAYEQRNEMIITILHYEIANVYFLMEDYENCENLYKQILRRILLIHKYSMENPSFIFISLKLALVFSKKNDFKNADVGFKYCINEIKKIIEKESELNNCSENTFAIYGYALNQYAHFLINQSPDLNLIGKAQMYFEMAIEEGDKIFGYNNEQMLHLLNNFAVSCILNNQFEIGKKYLEEALKRLLSSPDKVETSIAIYCNYAECLFHLGDLKNARIFVNKALIESKQFSKEIENFASDFYSNLITSIKQE
uniref:Tetratricopeptide repeat protein n=1 Tax=Parastrongyloides trichosuri TaxID=131310 RepID=A0A0N4ZA31_PARTI